VSPTPDPVATEIFRHLFIAIAEEMGVALERTAFSPNIKERRDHSCALFDAEGRLIAQAAHIPVHLGAFPLMMARLVPETTWQEGDVLLCNDPFVGGTHLPDLSMIAPVFTDEGVLFGFVANRAHHADIGGAAAGSMAPAREIYQEGVIVPPLKLVEAGRRNEAVLDLLCRNVRTPRERRGDLAAQVAANETGIRRFRELLAAHGPEALAARVAEARQQSEAAMRALLATLPSGDYAFTDALDDDGEGSGPVPITVTLRARGSDLEADFAGSAAQQRGAINAPLAVTHSAVLYCLLCLLPEEISFNAGCFAPIRITAPEGSVVNARPPAAVAGGNVETSQRIVDAVFGALAQALPDRVPAASQGTMNNVAIGGVDPATGESFAYYETLGGGTGGSPAGPGIDAVHCHMSNTRNTPAEAIEYHYPMRVRRYALADGSAGAGRHPGGRGLVREIELLADAQVSLLTDRRARGPYGLQGGAPGQPGANRFLSDGIEEPLPAKLSRLCPAGTVLQVRTPGGGGWGAPEPIPSPCARPPSAARARRP
jgi:N-methylhydantoinase B